MILMIEDDGDNDEKGARWAENKEETEEETDIVFMVKEVAREVESSLSNVAFVDGCSFDEDMDKALTAMKYQLRGDVPTHFEGVAPQKRFGT